MPLLHDMGACHIGMLTNEIKLIVKSYFSKNQKKKKYVMSYYCRCHQQHTLKLS